MKDASQVELRLYQALYGKAPSYVQLSAMKSQMAAEGAVAWSNAAAKGVDNMSTASFAALVLNNIGITTTSLTATQAFGSSLQAYNGLLGGFVDYLNSVGLSNRGVVVTQLTDIISKLEVDTQFGVYGPAAVAFNQQIAANSAYSSNVSSVTDAVVPVTPAAAKVYVIGASYSSDGPEDARLSTVVSGDARNVNGPVGQALWIENYATAIGALIPVSVTRKVPPTLPEVVHMQSKSALALQRLS
ncbi:MAG: hypothetical protein CFE44_02010 [Burkholderiales bacterium PBB4]|nr:MAG: hypothetical protein CFE44_02010 [Burkholderiales bacterium PBB4]